MFAEVILVPQGWFAVEATNRQNMPLRVSLCCGAARKRLQLDVVVVRR